MNRSTFKAPNGDTLNDLNKQKEEAQKLHLAARDKLVEAEQALRPLREEVSRHEAKVMNISCRLNTWWSAYRDADRRSGQPTRVRGPSVLIIDY